MTKHGAQQRKTPQVFTRTALACAIGHLAIVAGTTWPTAARAADETVAQAAPAAVRAYDIPAGPLDQALTRFGQESGILLAFSSETTDGRRSEGLKGTYTPAAGLDVLLRNTGLEAVQRSADSFALRKVAAAGTLGAPGQLSKVVVVGKTDAAESEGTHSYAAQAASTGKTGALSLREIPQSVSVVTNQQIIDQGMRAVDDALKQTPGVYVGGANSLYGDMPTYSSRGFEMAYSYDGMPAKSSGGHGDDMAMVDRVEVLRGPAALLRSASNNNAVFGGLVNVVRKRPSKEFGVSAEVGAGSWNQYRGAVDVNGALVEDGRIRARGVFAAGDRDFFYGTASHRRNWTAYGVVEADLTPSTLWSMSLTQGHIKTQQPYTGVPVYPGGKPVTTDRSFIVNEESGYYKFKSTLLSTDLTHQFDNGWKVKGSVSYRRSEENVENLYADWMVDPDTNTVDYARYAFLPTDYKTLAMDVNVGGPFQLLGRTHQLNVGVDGNKSSFGYRSASSLYSGVDVFNPDLGTPTDSVPLSNYAEQEFPQHGLYAVTQLSLTDQVTFVLGARLSNYENKTRTATDSDAGEWSTRVKISDKVTPYGGLIWNLNEQVTLYASYTDIFAPQTSLTSGGKTIDPRVGWQGEVGAKGEFFDKKLNTAISIYRLRDTNRSVRDPNNNGCAGSPTSACYIAAGLTQSEGVDLEVSGSPWPGLQLTGGYTYNHNEYLEDGAAENIGQQFSGQTPRHLFKLWGTYRFASEPQVAPAGGWRVGAGVVAQSDTFLDSDTRRGGFAVVNAQVGYNFSPKTSLDLNVNNLFDRHYLSVIDYAFALYGEPRSAQLTLRHKF